MPLPNVTILTTNGGLGQISANDDSVCGLVANGVAATGLALGVSKQGFSIADFEAVGITAAYDTTNSVKVWRQIMEFYDEAAPGTELWVMLVSQATTITLILDKTQNFAKKLLADAGGRIRVLGVSRNPAPGYTPNTTANQIDLDVISALTTGQSLADDMQAAFTPVRFIIEGYAYTGTTVGLANLRAQTKPNMAVFVGNSETGARSAIGLLLGRLSSVPVQRNPGRVKDGSLAISAAFLGSATLESVESQATSLHNNGFITLRRFPGRAGYYFSDDPTCDLPTSDYNALTRGRVIDKVIRISFVTFVNEILDEVLIDSEGKISVQKAKYYQTLIQSAVDTAMTANGEISELRVFVDPAQNVLSTGRVCVNLSVVPVGYAKEIQIRLGFYNPAIS